VAPELDHALHLLHHELGEPDVPVGGLVEGGADHLAAHGPPHVGDLLRPLVEQQDDDLHLRAVARDAVAILVIRIVLPARAARRSGRAARARAGRRGP